MSDGHSDRFKYWRVREDNITATVQERLSSAMIILPDGSSVPISDTKLLVKIPAENTLEMKDLIKKLIMTGAI